MNLTGENIKCVSLRYQEHIGTHVHTSSVRSTGSIPSNIPNTCVIIYNTCIRIIILYSFFILQKVNNYYCMHHCFFIHIYTYIIILYFVLNNYYLSITFC
jgi:hypothetical protein